MNTISNLEKNNYSSKPFFGLHCKIAFSLLTLLIFITGIIYPLFITGLAQILFTKQANGSLIIQKQKIVGSELIGQFFQDPKYFWGRPSATKPYPYNAAASDASHLGPSNPILLEKMKEEAYRLKKVDLTNILNIPIDLVTTSGSGLDPHISLESAIYQVNRIASIRNISEEQLTDLIYKQLEKRQWGFLGRERINVLKLNLALDALSIKRN